MRYTAHLLYIGKPVPVFLSIDVSGDVDEIRTMVYEIVYKSIM